MISRCYMKWVSCSKGIIGEIAISFALMAYIHESIICSDDLKILKGLLQFGFKNRLKKLLAIKCKYRKHNCMLKTSTAISLRRSIKDEERIINI